MKLPFVAAGKEFIPIVTNRDRLDIFASELADERGVFEFQLAFVARVLARTDDSVTRETILDQDALHASPELLFKAIFEAVREARTPKPEPIAEE